MKKSSETNVIQDHTNKSRVTLYKTKFLNRSKSVENKDIEIGIMANLTVVEI